MKNNIFVTLFTVSAFTLLMLCSCRNNDEREIEKKEDNTEVIPEVEKNPNFIVTCVVFGGSSYGFTIYADEDYKEKYDYNVYWSKIDSPDIKGEVLNNKGDALVQLPSAGMYKVEIGGKFPSANKGYFANSAGGNGVQLLSIENWGDIEWIDMSYALQTYGSLKINAKDAPKFSKGASLRGAFKDCFVNVDISNWDVSNVTDMREMFQNARLFNSPLDKWDVSNVTDMSEMFQGAVSFDQPLNSWDVSNVTNMSDMFQSARLFNQPLDKWNVSNVTDMSGMFGGASYFNQPLDKWNVSNVTDMSYMFSGALSFNQSLNSWNITKILSDDGYYGMFDYAGSFDQSNISSWNLTKKQKKDMNSNWVNTDN